MATPIAYQPYISYNLQRIFIIKRTHMSLATHVQSLQSVHLRDLFAQDAMRKNAMQITCDELTLDFSHQRISTRTLCALETFADEHNLNTHISALINGENVNQTENRPALHTALRDPSATPIFVNNQDIKPKIRAAFDTMHALCKTIWQSGISDVLVLGIGGSYWGSLCACEALRTLPKRLNMHFLADIEAEAFDHTIHKLQPEKTIVLVISKSFTTQETLCNAMRARTWLGPLFKAHCMAITANCEAAQTFGVDPHYILNMWPWVGGRYSVWSTVGMPIALCYGMVTFQALLNGAHTMDQHLINAPMRNNLPMMAALLSFLNIRFFNSTSEALIPYGSRLCHFVPYVQQLKMESLGKSRDIHGNLIFEPTGSIIWGQTGIHAQHTFNQILHQGSHYVPIDFIVPMDQGELVNACFAQSQALAFGEPNHSLLHARTEGNQGHNILKIKTLNAQTLGMLMAFYEHKTYLLACLFNINAFDQFGIELAKKITGSMREVVTT
jgi:glucose-6-phosphate isomerase